MSKGGSQLMRPALIVRLSLFLEVAWYATGVPIAAGRAAASPGLAAAALPPAAGPHPGAPAEQRPADVPADSRARPLSLARTLFVLSDQRA